ncbi:MAG: tRNA lysidine(34) synthetase TilS [Marinisporobacter sp.]|jgi:tRNA(Ile)-lysidine synthase|nr:tRNA lysidine(34) synthetase TilS [Marinisporobacter sp.]
MLEKFLQTVKKHHMFQKGDGIVIGVSGGPDSMTLLHLFYRIREEYDLNLYAVHLNHQFRGKEADADAEYVRRFCENIGVKAFMFSENIALYSRERGITFEESGRERRYKLFHEVMKDMGASKIAVAQNLDDQAETLLMRLMRGSGIEGLSAIDYVRDRKVIRPILDITREEIESYCREYDLHPRIDQTNLEAVYTRNRIRLELIPYIEKHFNRNIKEVLARTTNLIREDKDFLNLSAQESYRKLVKKENLEIIIRKKDFERQHIAIKKRILRKAILEIQGDLKDIQSKHIQKILNLIQYGQVGNHIDLPKYLYVVLDYENVVIRKGKRKIENNDFEYNINIGETLNIKELNTILIALVVDHKEIKNIPKEKDKKYFDFDKIKNHMIVRNRKNGDRFIPLGMKGSKKLKDFFIDQKIAREERNQIPLVCDGEKIIWVIGHRMSEEYKVQKDTKKVLVLCYRPYN